MKEADINIVYSFNRLALMLTACPHDADDIIQETAVSVLRNYDRFANFTEAGKRNYIITCLHSKFIDIKRKQKTRLRYTSELSKRVSSPSVYAKISLQEMRVAAQGSFTADAAILFGSGYNVKEIAAAMKIKVNTALGRVRYGREHLKKKLYEQK